MYCVTHNLIVKFTNDKNCNENQFSLSTNIRSYGSTSTARAA